MRTTRSDLDWVQRITVERGTRRRSEAFRTSLKGDASIGTPWLLEEDMRKRSLLSEYMALHPSLTHHRNINPFENKVWEIYFHKKVCSFIEVRKLCLIMFPLVFVLRLYNAAIPKKDFNVLIHFIYCPVGWGCRIHWLLLCRGVRPPPPTRVLDMTLNNLMVRFQQCWSFGECGVPLHCHRSQVHSGPEW